MAPNKRQRRNIKKLKEEKMVGKPQILPPPGVPDNLRRTQKRNPGKIHRDHKKKIARSLETAVSAVPAQDLPEIIWENPVGQSEPTRETSKREDEASTSVEPSKEAEPFSEEARNAFEKVFESTSNYGVKSNLSIKF